MPPSSLLLALLCATAITAITSSPSSSPSSSSPSSDEVESAACVFDGYDVIVVGSGASGGTFGVELARNAKKKVLMLERGVANPAADSKYGWPYVTATGSNVIRGVRKLCGVQAGLCMHLGVPVDGATGCCELPGDWIPEPMVVGGGTATNAGNFRPTLDHDLMTSSWAPALADGFGGVFDEIVAEFGQSTYTPTGTTFADDMKQALESVFVAEEGAAVYDGQTAFDATTTQRHYYGPQVLTSAKGLELMTGATVSRVLMCADGGGGGGDDDSSSDRCGRALAADGTATAEVVASGVEFVHADGRTCRAYVKRDGKVVLSAGVNNTPKLLMLSGIGARDQLEAAGIAVVVENEHVGQNLWDEPVLPIAILNKQSAETPIPFTIRQSFAMKQYPPQAGGAAFGFAAETSGGNVNTLLMSTALGGMPFFVRTPEVMEAMTTIGQWGAAHGTNPFAPLDDAVTHLMWVRNMVSRGSVRLTGASVQDPLKVTLPFPLGPDVHTPSMPGGEPAFMGAAAGVTDLLRYVNDESVEKWQNRTSDPVLTLLPGIASICNPPASAQLAAACAVVGALFGDLESLQTEAPFSFPPSPKLSSNTFEADAANFFFMFSNPGYHFQGTTALGLVVDATFSVHGVANLMVVDASVAPIDHPVSGSLTSFYQALGRYAARRLANDDDDADAGAATVVGGAFGGAAMTVAACVAVLAAMVVVVGVISVHRRRRHHGGGDGSDDGVAMVDIESTA